MDWIMWGTLVAAVACGFAEIAARHRPAVERMPFQAMFAALRGVGHVFKEAAAVQAVDVAFAFVGVAVALYAIGLAHAVHLVRRREEL